jgi:BMFP domain-containing protein YqiC
MADRNREAELEQRIAELERRLGRYEGRSGPETAFWAIMHRIFPEDARRHMKVATREQLMAARSYLDRWIARLEESADGDRDAERRETIEVE